jgi:uncharacterized damage-inducible protein DinB
VNTAEVRTLYAYNLWANRRVLNTSRLLHWPDFIRDIGASHGSIRGTLVHILWGEWLWLRRWQGESPRQVFAAEEFSDWMALECRWSALEQEQNGFLEGLTDARLSMRVSYDNLQSVRWEYSLAEMMQHLVNHSSSHRGQVAVLLRQLGQKPLTTDFLVFLDEQRALAGEGGS